MKKLRLYKKDLAKVSEDDMAFIEAYKAIKAPPYDEPKEARYKYDKTTGVISYSYVSKEWLQEFCDKLKSGERVYINGALQVITEHVDPKYTIDKEKYDKANHQYIEDMSALHPIVVDILQKAKSK